MSKSLGNGIDPLDVIEKYSTDASGLPCLSVTPGKRPEVFRRKG